MKTSLQNLIRLIFAALLLAAAPHVAWAGAPSCTVNSPALAFGAYDPMTGAAVTATATLTITCNKKNYGPFPITLDMGLYATSFNPRVMKNADASDTLNYNLYTSASYVATNIWGDGTNGTLTVSYTTDATSTATVTIYGQIPMNLDPSSTCPGTPCAYSDTVNITVNF